MSDSSKTIMTIGSANNEPTKLTQQGNIYRRRNERWVPMSMKGIDPADRVVHISTGVDGRMFVTTLAGHSYTFGYDTWLNIT